MSGEIAEPRYAKQREVVVGTALIADGGFTCLTLGTRLTVEGDAEGLFVRCSEGFHYLCGQLERGEYIGLTIANGVQS